jgi:mannose-1-phosphate guanylyltransferase
MALWAVIMAGGSGTRFWPASRVARPKQLLPLAEPNRSLLASTVARLHPLVPAERIVVVTAAKLADATRDELPDVPSENVLAEPAPRNTAPCIGWASRVIGARDPDSTIAVLPSDHHVADAAGFRAAIEKAAAASQHRAIVTIGIKPTRPDTGYGYIEVGAKIDGDASEVVRFVEKPDLARAKEFVASGRFLWNGGMFFFRAQHMDRAIQAHMPGLAADLDRMCTGRASDVENIFPELESKSIDYGVIEPTSKENGKLAVVAGDFGWSDVGSWESAWELAHKDESGNALPEGAVAVDARGNLARTSSKKVVALVGVNDLVVVETEDALLVMPRSRAQDVRAVVDALKSSGKTDKI